MLNPSAPTSFKTEATDLTSFSRFSVTTVSKRCVGDQHYVCVVNPDQQNPERVGGFPVEIDVEEGENDAGDNIFDDDDPDSGCVPTTSKVRSEIRSGTSTKEAELMPVCKPVGGHQLVDVNKRQKKVDRQLSSIVRRHWRLFLKCPTFSAAET